MMMARNLRATALFAAVPDSAISSLQHSMNAVAVAPGQVLLERLDASSPILIIVAGEVILECDGGEGGEGSEDSRVDREAFRANDLIGLFHFVLGRASMHMPSMHMPYMHMPSMHMPPMHMPSMHMPSMHMPSMYMPSMHVPSMHMPSMI